MDLEKSCFVRDSVKAWFLKKKNKIHHSYLKYIHFYWEVRKEH